ncbi:MAG: DDE-type integrase/transposase/recombinase [Acidobacteriaceae bacterium]|nr:DDE-type integrase/transposase/recombinase [Acidobacteriaceae bacterium]
MYVVYFTAHETNLLVYYASSIEKSTSGTPARLNGVAAVALELVERVLLGPAGMSDGCGACDFLLTAKRDQAAAQRFFRKALRGSSNLAPRVINVDKKAAYPAAFRELKAEGFLSRRCRLRQCKFLNDVIAQDHRILKRRVNLKILTTKSLQHCPQFC